MTAAIPLEKSYKIRYNKDTEQREDKRQMHYDK